MASTRRRKLAKKQSVIRFKKKKPRKTGKTMKKTKNIRKQWQSSGLKKRKNI